MKTDIDKATDVLLAGGVLLYPTDTVWGLGCDATNDDAVAKIYKIKKRKESKSLIVLVADEAELIRYVHTLPDLIRKRIETSDKPVTVVYSKAQGLAKSVLAADGSVAIRIVKDEFCKTLIKKLGKPIVSTSANKSGEKAPAIFSEITKEIIAKVDYVVKWRQNDTNKSQPSAIIRLSSSGEIEIIRE